MKRHLRPSPLEVDASPSIDWVIEWKLEALSQRETTVQRKVYGLVQRTNRWLPMHWLLPLAAAEEHAAMIKQFPAARR